MHLIEIAGSRGYANRHFIWETLDGRLAKDANLLGVHGACEDSPDLIAAGWFMMNELPCLSWPARWNHGTHGSYEGPLRNQHMNLWLATQRDLGDSCEFVGFWDGRSRGTINCLAIAHRVGTPVTVFDHEGTDVTTQALKSAKAWYPRHDPKFCVLCLSGEHKTDIGLI